MALVVLLLWRSIWKSVPITVCRFCRLSFLGFLAAIVLGLGNFAPVAHGLAWQGSIYLLGAAAIIGCRKKEGRRQSGFAIVLLVLTLAYLGFCIEGLLIEPTALVVKHHVLETEKITKPMRIVFLADLQTDVIGEYERRTLQRVREQGADLILLGGDYLQVRSRKHELQLADDFSRLLKEVDLQAPLGIFAVKGNQEYGSWIGWSRHFNGTNILPVEQTSDFDVGEIRLTLLSVEDSYRPKSIPAENPENRFRILLGHVPEFATVRQGADLLLAGHTHGGQVWIPGFGPIFNATDSLPRAWSSGRTKLPNGGILLITNGSGMERGRAPRVRLFCKPDFLVIDLVPKEI